MEPQTDAPQAEAAPRDGEAPPGIPTGFGPSGRAGAPPVQRVRVVFQKGPALRFIGHLDLVRMWERAFRRAQLPLAYTLGYTPHPRLTFAAPLALGATSDGEVLDVYLREALPVEELVRRISEQLPQGCTVVSAQEVELIGPAASALTRWAEYRIEVSAPDAAMAAAAAAPEQGSRWARRTTSESRDERATADVNGEQDDEQAPWRPEAERLPPLAEDGALPPAKEIQERMRALLAAESLPRERVREGKAVSYDLRPLVVDVWLADEPIAGEDRQKGGTDSATRATLGAVLKLDSNGAGRPEEVAAALGLRARRVHRVRIGMEGDEVLNGKAPSP